VLEVLNIVLIVTVCFKIPPLYEVLCSRFFTYRLCNKISPHNVIYVREIMIKDMRRTEQEKVRQEHTKNERMKERSFE
jgi:hypothetical protein